MEWISSIVNFLMENFGKISATLLAALGLAEAITRFTPTEKDDGAVERIGAFIRKVLDFFKMPNVKKPPKP